MKIKSRRDLIKTLEDNGFFLEKRTMKHEKYSNGTTTVTVPKKHSKRFSEILAAKIIRQANIQ